MTEEELAADEHHTMMKSVTKEAKAKGKNSGMTIPTMLLLLVLSMRMLTNAPGLSAIPLIQMLISKSGSNIDSIVEKMYLGLEPRLRVYPCMNMLVDVIVPMILNVMHV